MKFAIQIENQFGYSWSEIKNIIELTEEHRYYSFYICDHFFLNKDAEDIDALEAYSVLSAAAAITDTIKLGTLVTGNNYRNPALLAKIVASIDVISNGRIELGIGTGWKEMEYNAYGYKFPSVKTRFAMLDESLNVIRKLFSEKRVNYSGKYYQLRDAVFSPKADPMILIGGDGEKKTLKLVAKYADYMNLPFTAMPDIARKLKALKTHADNIGRDYDSIGKSIFMPIWVGESEEEVGEFMQKAADDRNISVNEFDNRINYPEYPGRWIGTVNQVVERIKYMEKLGFDYIFIQLPFDRSFEFIEKFDRLVKTPYFS